MQPASDRDGVLRAASDYVESWLDGDVVRMASCLHPALAKRAAVDPGSRDLGLDEAPFDYMTTTAVRSGPKPYGREIDIAILDLVDGIATAKVVSQPFVDLLHLARFAHGWLIVNALYQERPQADTRGDAAGVVRSLDDYSKSWFGQDEESARRAVHPALVERKVADPEAGALDLDETTFEELLEIVAEGPDEPIERAWDARVLDLSGDIASGKVTAAWWEVYLHLARFANRWLIVNILYRARKGAS